MRHLGEFHEQAVQGLTGARLGIAPDTDDRAHSERLDHDAQQLVAFLVHRRHDLRGKFLRDDVPSLLGVLKEQQRAVIVYEVIDEEGLGLTEAFLEKPPETPAADL